MRLLEYIYSSESVSNRAQRNDSAINACSHFVLLSLLGALLCLLALPSPASGETIAQAVYNRLQSLDPVYTTTSETYVYSGNLFEPLILSGGEGEMLPGQAESWQLSDDKLEYTFKLRDDSKWSDGHPVTAHDFVTAFRRLADPKINQLPKPTYLIGTIENALQILDGTAPPESLGVTAEGDRVLKIRLNAPASYFLSILTYPGLAPVPSHIIEALGEEWQSQIPLVSNGPYTLISRSESHDILDRSETYWGRSQPDMLELVFYDSQKSVMADLMSGRLDIAADLPRSQTQWLAKSFPGKIKDYLDNGTIYLMFNTDKEHLADPKIRRALAMALDKEFLIKRLDLASHQVAHTFSTPEYGSSAADVRADWTSMNLEQRQQEARRLLDSAGYNAANPLRVELLARETLHLDKVATLTKSAWGSIGVDVVIDLAGKGGLSGRLNARKYEISVAGWFADYPHPMTFLGLFRSNSSKNRTGWASAEYDTLLDATLLETDVHKQRQIHRKLETMLLSELPVLPIFHPSSTLVTSDKIGDYQGFGYGLLARNVSLDN